MMKIFPGMSLEYAKRMNWLEGNILISCYNRDMRERKRLQKASKRRAKKLKLRRRHRSS